MSFDLEKEPVFKLLQKKTGVTVKDLEQVKLEYDTTNGWKYWAVCFPAGLVEMGKDGGFYELKTVMLMQWFYSPESSVPEYEPVREPLGFWLSVQGHFAEQALKQSERASKPRTPDLNQIIQRLAREDDSAKGLWPELYGRLDAEGLDPQPIEKNGQPAYSYLLPNDKRKEITLKTFSNRLSESR